MVERRGNRKRRMKAHLEVSEVPEQGEATPPIEPVEERERKARADILSTGRKYALERNVWNLGLLEFVTDEFNKRQRPSDLDAEDSIDLLLPNYPAQIPGVAENLKKRGLTIRLLAEYPEDSINPRSFNSATKASYAKKLRSYASVLVDIERMANHA